MIITQLRGGLGNQMFQYALGRRLALERSVPLKIDLSWFATQDKRKFELGDYNIHAEFASQKETERMRGQFNNRYLRKAFLMTQRFLPRVKRRVIRELSAGTFDKEVLNVSKHCIIEGYWQCSKYFSSIAPLLQNEFLPTIELSTSDQRLADTIQQDTHSVSIHIRRGDYVADYEILARHYICTPDYYREAVLLIESMLNHPINIYLFSDDPQWCRQEFGHEWTNLFIISSDERSSTHEQFLMSQCHHHIIPNSSFSWWSAWLSKNPNKIVISPTKWFAKSEVPDVTPPEWIKFQHDDRNDWKYIDIPYAKKRYYATFGRELNLDEPRAFTEKLQWLKLYDRQNYYSNLTDKYLAREYIKSKVGDKYLIKLYGVYNHPEQINWSTLPNKFIIKANHGCGWNIICYDKNRIDIFRTNQILNKWLSQNYYYYGREWVYKNISPKILFEQFLECENNLGLADYRFYCFNGNPEFIKVDLFNDKGQKERTFYDLDWCQLNDFTMTIPEQSQKSIKAPARLDEMIQIAKHLSADIPFLRVDMYYINNRIYCGELTFYPVAGFVQIFPDEYDFILGEKLSLPC